MNTSKILNTTAILMIMAVVDLSMLSIGAFAADTPEEFIELEEIVVTARKREERLRDVPASVSALTASQMELLQLDGMDDYLRQMTGAILISTGPEYLSDVSIRGQGGGRLGFSETATALFRNGIYIAGGGFGGRSLSRMDLFDAQSVQVYRGPQGALYGRNAVGGAINVISKRPTNNFEGRVKGSYKSFDRLDFEGIMNIPLVEDKLALRFGGYWFDQNGGQVTDVNTGRTLDRRDAYGIRIVAEAKPNENLTTLLTVEYRESEAPAFSSLGYRALKTNNTVLDPTRFERDISTDGRVQIEETTIFFEAGLDTKIGKLHGVFNYKTRNGARLNDDFDHFIGLQGRVFGGTPVDMLSNQSEDFIHYGGEVILTSPDDNSKWNWLFGAEFQSTEDDVSTTIGGTGIIAPLRALLRTDAFHEELTSLAVFGAIDFDVSRRWNISIEARVQNDQKNFTFNRVPDNPALTTALMVVDKKEWTRLTPSVTLTYDVSDDVMSYLRVATAYRPGGFNAGIPADIPNVGDVLSYDPESITSAEIGFKWSSFEGKVQSEIAFFYSRTKDVQSVTSPSLTVSQFILLNSGDMDTWGIDFETRGIFEIGPGNFIVTLGASTNDGSFKDGASVISTGELIDISGLRVNRTRDYTLNLNLTYRFQVMGDMTAIISGSMQAEGGGFENVINSRDLEGYELFDLSVSLISENWKFSLFGKNLTDEVYRLQQINLNNYFNQRRTWGGSITLTF